ncbi:MAG TPA: hypothetical protein VFN96_04370, partial [Gemmatimonadales bacterium]|nr:hypothetical protein [Gemmatimonadales bacterium]
MSRLDRALTAAAAGLLAVLGFLPLADWIPGGLGVPGWRDRLDAWWSGTLVVAGAGLVIAILSRRIPRLASTAPLAAVAASWNAQPARWTLGLAAAGFALYLAVALGVHSGRPLFIDEIVQVVQARIFAGGSLTAPAGAHPEFLWNSLMLERDGRAFSQFPAGGPGMLALGSLAGSEWIVGPLFGAVSAGVFAVLARRIEARAGVACAAACLFAFAPFVGFMSGSHMNHVSLLTWVLLGCLGLERLTSGAGRAGWGVLAGLGFGVAATIRPADAAAFAVPAAVWLLARAVRRGGWGPVLAAGLAFAVPVGAQLWINARTTGAPLLFGYVANWGPEHALGFHRTPWGEMHTPGRGLQLLNIYFLRLQSHLLELPVPSLLPATLALVMTRRLAPFDRYLLASAAALTGTYLAWWHDGDYLGPRFLYPLAPVLALWTARAVPLLSERLQAPLARRTLGFGTVTALIVGVTVLIPHRAREYRNGLGPLRRDPDRAAAAAGVRDAIVFVRESWGSQLLARMWAAGVTRSDAERFHRRADACALEQTLDSIEMSGARGQPATERIRLLLADSARVVR